MPEYLSPGVYVEEFEIGAKPIEGVSTSTAGFLGETERGPTVPRLVTSWLEYQRVFGSYLGSDKYLPYTVQGFFDNGGKRCYVGRIVKAGDAAATAATVKLAAGSANALTVTAIGEGAWGNRVAVKVSPGSLSGFRLSVYYWKSAPTALFDPDYDQKANPRPTAVEFYDNLSVDEASPDYYDKRVNAVSSLVRLGRLAGDTGGAPDAKAGHMGTAQSGAASTITLASTASATDDAYNGMQVWIVDKTGKGQVRTISDYVGSTRVATVSAAWTTQPDSTSVYYVSSVASLAGGGDVLAQQGTAQAGAASTITLAAGASAVNNAYNGMAVEILSGTGLGQKRTISGYVGSTRVATVSVAWTTQPDATSVYRITPALILSDYERGDTDSPGNRKGLTGFKEIDDISLVYAPNAQGVAGLPGSLITHCENLKDRFAIIDAAQGSTVSNLSPRDTNETKYGAFYYPWLKVIDPEAGVQRLVPPGGHVAGIYARSDTERGVHKAPANEKVNGAVDLEFPITKGEQDVLNPRGVNVIRAFPGRGIRVWGARTLSSDPLWKYVNVRRLFIFLEESIDEGTQWVVFEPNDIPLWARVRQTIVQFLTGVWRTGALAGATPEEAFFVKCDRTTMTQDDIDNGRLICVIGVAPVKPAEFVIFRIAQWTAGAKG